SAIRTPNGRCAPRRRRAAEIDARRPGTAGAGRAGRAVRAAAGCAPAPLRAAAKFRSMARAGDFPRAARLGTLSTPRSQPEPSDPPLDPKTADPNPSAPTPIAPNLSAKKPMFRTQDLLHRLLP